MIINEYSKEHALFLKAKRKRKRIVTGARIGLLALFLGAWEIFADAGWIDPFIMSSPSRIVKTVVSLAKNGELFVHIGYTLLETTLGFLIATVLGTLVATLLWWSETARDVLDPYIVVLNGLPKIALGPILIVWVGAGINAIIAMTVLVCVIITTIDMLNGFIHVDKDKLLLMQTMHANKWQTYKKLVFPSNVKTLLGVLKINVGLSWVGSIMGEYLVSKAGLGYLIVYGGQIFKLDLVMASTVILCLLAALMYGIVAVLDKIAKKKHY